MNKYKYDDLSVGMSATFEAKITKEMMEGFRQITGDTNPLHCDLRYANEKGFDTTVVYGMLTASFLSTLAGVYLPGRYSLIHSVDTKMIKPVFVEDKLIISGEITEKNDTFQLLRINAKIFRYLEKDKKEVVLKAVMKVGVTSGK